MMNEEKEELQKFVGFMSHVSIEERFLQRVALQLGISDTLLKVLVYLKVHPEGAGRKEMLRLYDIKPSNFSRSLKLYNGREFFYEKNRLLFITDEGKKVLSELHDVVIAMQTTDRPYEEYLQAIDTKKHFR